MTIRNIRRPFLSLLLTIALCNIAAGQEDVVVREHPMQEHFDKVRQLLADSDSFAAIQYIQNQGDPKEVVELYLQTALWLYNNPKDVAAMVAISRAGIQYGLTEAERIQESDAETAVALRGQAKAMAYNLGANMWPGWQDEGIALTARDVQAGADAAGLNLRLAIELERDALPLCNAHWLIGAHHLAAGEYAAATEAFHQGEEQGTAAERPEFEAMCRGYRWMATRLAQPDVEAAVREFAAAVAQLRKLETDDATFFADQLESVFALFSAKADVVR